MHYTFTLILLLLTSVISIGQNIKWAADRDLTWEDFQGGADVSSKFHAQTQSGVKYSYRWQSSNKNTTYTFEVFSYCDKSLSWVKRGKETNALLAHEQLHFDISELHARKLKQSIASSTFSKSHNAEIKNLFKANQRAREAMQEQYDSETNHMKNQEEQIRWQQLVASELERLQEFEGTEVVN